MIAHVRQRVLAQIVGEVYQLARVAGRHGSVIAVAGVLRESDAHKQDSGARKGRSQHKLARHGSSIPMSGRKGAFAEADRSVWATVTAVLAAAV
jgi:hypothetical protein